MLKNGIFSAIAALISTICTILFFSPIHRDIFAEGVFLFFLLFAAYYIVLQNKARLLSLFRSKQWIAGLFMLLFPFFAVLSMKGEQTHLQHSPLFIKFLIYIGTYVSTSIIVLFAASLILSIKPNRPNPDKKWGLIFVYALPSLIVWPFYLIAFFPGAMTADSIFQWEQAHTGKFNDWHPVMYTFFIMMVTAIWDSPAAIGIAQIIIISIVIGYCLFELEKAGAPKWAVWTVSILFAVSPVNGIYSITVWKDILYSTFILLFTTLICKLIMTNGNWLNRFPSFIFFTMAALGVVFFRHNGFVVCLASLIILFAVFRHLWKRWLLVISLVVVIHYAVTGPLFTYLNVTPSDPNEALSIPTQQIARVIAHNGKMTEQQAEYINKIMSLDLWKKLYNPYVTDPIKFSGYYNKTAIFPDHLSTYLRTWWEICLQNPRLVIEAMMKQTSLVWQMNEPNDGYTSMFVTNVFYGNKFGLKNEVISQPITNMVGTYLKWSETTGKPFLWRPAVYMFSILLFTFIAFLRNDRKAWLLPIAVLLNAGTVFIALPAQDFRYLYSNSLVFFIAFLFAFISYRKTPNGIE
ncbi:DUF6020 family protein [Parageobacillus toebii]|uniref:DUF6020 family protein n=1 Tax=Parageobacillus toebii TaxID=153151 RepID=UPI00196866D3|nr:DUF6020 family protein [Parageobacillus toebii]QSB49444.1 hypothetical protein JTI59_03895 [Parageobacillus toebii]